jgi:ABC-type lipoprotein export system ATPase subunit
VDDQDYENLSAAQMADLRLHRIGFIFQAYNLIPVLSAVENVEYVMLLQGIPAKTRRQKARQDSGHRRPRGVTFIFSTHDNMVMDFARRIVMLRDGQVESDRNKTGS